MPRLSPSLLLYAASLNKHLPRLLRECRDLESASNELRWLAEHASDTSSNHKHFGRIGSSVNSTSDVRLARYVRRRARGEPLQYILGSQPFGELDILCRPNVLIPRPETELYTTKIAELLISLQHNKVDDLQQPIRIADLCTGSGCIALLLHSILRPARSDTLSPTALELVGLDISPHAIDLARENLKHNLHGGVLHTSCTDEVQFRYTDVLDLGNNMRSGSAAPATSAKDNVMPFTGSLGPTLDVIVSNPPYITPSEYAPGGSVGRSVRNFEPKLALVPPPFADVHEEDIHRADQFYEVILHIARKTQTKLLVMEIGDSFQAQRVRSLVSKVMSDAIWVEMWRDDGSITLHDPPIRDQEPERTAHAANERAVVVWAGNWADWRLRNSS